MVELKDDAAAAFGPDFFLQIIITIRASIRPFLTLLPPAFDEVTTLRRTLVSANFEAFLDSCLPLESLTLDNEDVWLSLTHGMTFLNEHGGVCRLAKILEFIDCRDYCPLWKDQLNDSAQHERSFDFRKAALINNISTHSRPGACIPPTPQPHLRLPFSSQEWATQMS